ncbi:MULTISPECIES: hypothetical protein [unclassified Streptomyces]|uniref:hypothetical protein n=2 Tax=Streptomyces TaxID=1883 RepID=UPI0011614A76|nr:hypothetical protein [Streptomyces sp. CB02366]NUS76654.1 hypothetical protein [Streptomyces sp.]
MRPEMLTALSALAVAGVTAVGGIVTAVIGRRQPRSRGADRRDDFSAVTDKLGQHIERLERRVTEGETRAAEAQQRITAQDYTIRYLVGWVRSLVSFIRRSQMEPPPPPQPVPAEAEPYLHDVGL